MRQTVSASARQSRAAAVAVIRTRFEQWAPGYFARAYDVDGQAVLGVRNGKPWNHLTRGAYASPTLREAWASWLASATAAGTDSPNAFIGDKENSGYLVRFADALEILCTARPDLALCEQWLRNTPEGEQLQAWAVDHMRANWGTGLGVLDAAEVMAESPEEGMHHDGCRNDFKELENAS